MWSLDTGNIDNLSTETQLLPPWYMSEIKVINYKVGDPPIRTFCIDAKRMGERIKCCKRNALRSSE